MAVAVLAGITLVLGACGSDEPSAEPSVRDTTSGEATDNSGSVLQATIADGGTGDGTTGETGDDGASGGTGGASGGTDDAPGSTTSPSSTADDGGFCGSSQPTPIEFDRGTSSATIDIAASDGKRYPYAIEVGAGQIMTIEITTADATAAGTLRAPTTDRPSTSFTERTILPTRAGTYEICVTAGPSGADIQLFVSVIDDNTPVRVDASWCGSTVNDRGEIRFEPGAFGTTIEGGVLRDERDLYVLEAGAGQAIELFLTSLEDNAVFSLRSPSGEMMIDEVSDIRIPLPEDGDYQICIGSVRGNASYTLDVTII